MVTVLLIGITVAVLTAGLTLLIALWRGAFRGDEEVAADSLLAWRPAYIQGEALRDWAAQRAEALARTELTANRPGDAAVRLVRALGTAAGHAMLPLARTAELERVIACPSAGQGLVGVTVPEVIALATHLRRQKSPRELQRIQALALENALQLESKPGQPSGPLPLRCPLQGADHVCCVYTARPLYCRPAHAASVASQMGNRSVRFGLPRQAASEASVSHEQTVVEGIEIGFARALKTAGLDANCYELNSALAKALEVPDAAERWARGENVFGTCRTLSRK